MRTRSSKGSLSTLGAALLALLVLGALFGSASASAATQHWYGYAGGTKLAEKTPTEVVAEDFGTGVTLQFRYAGIELDVGCTSLSAGGKIENPSGGGGGTLSGAGLTLEECAVTRPAGSACTVSSTIVTNALKGEVTKYEGSPAIKYSPAEGTEITTFAVGGGGCPHIIAGNKTLTGSFIAEYLGEGGYYQVRKLSSEDLKFGGTPVALVTTYQLASKSGKEVALATDYPGVDHWYLGGAPAEGAKTKFAEGSSVSYSSMSGSVSYAVSATVAGVKFKLQCPSSSASGSVKNPAGGGAGTASGTMAFGSCSVVEPAGKGCTVEGGGASSQPLSGLATESGVLPAVTISPAEGTKIATLAIGGASCPAALKGNKNLTGSLTGVPDPFGTYAFSGNAGLTYGGQAATFSGQATLETSTGERLGIAP